MIVHITRDDIDTFTNLGRVAGITGTDEEGRRVPFAIGWEAMDGLLASIDRCGETVAEIEEWQVLEELE